MNKERLSQVVTYDDKCWFCDKGYTVEEQKEARVVYCPNPTGRIACKSCWDNFVNKLKGLLQYLTLGEIK